MKRLLFALTMMAWSVFPPVVDTAHGGQSLADALTGLPVIRGTQPTHGDLEGQVVMVAFFASWCPPCKHEFPHLNTVQDAYGGDGLRIVAVNVFETFDGLSTPEKLEIFLDEVAPIFPILKGNAETRRSFGNLDRIPTLFVFDREGAPAFIFRHERDAEKTHLTEEELRAAIEPLL